MGQLLKTGVLCFFLICSLLANDAQSKERREAFNRHEMEKKFKMEEEILDMTVPSVEKQKLQKDLDTLYYNGSEGLPEVTKRVG